MNSRTSEGRRAFLASTSLLATTFLQQRLLAEDWPQWRGVHRDGAWAEENITDKLPSPQIPLKWRAPIGAGYSGPTVADGLVYVTDRVEEPSQIERVHCFDADNGNPVWSHSYECPYTISYPAGPRASVGIHQGVAFALGAMGHLHAFAAKTGQVIWKRDLSKDFNIDMPIWGISASPLVVDKLIIMQIGGKDNACVVALDTESGKTVWTALDEPAQYSAPILIEQAGQPIVVVWTGASVSGLALQSGEVRWRIDFPVTRMPIGVATPVVHDNRIFVTSFYDGSMMIEFDKQALTATKLWHEVGRDEQHTEALHSIISTPIFDGNYIYGVDSYGELRCLDAKTGKRIWEDRNATPRERWSTIHFVQRKDQVWMLNEEGDLIIANLTAQGYQELSRSHLLKPTQSQLSRRGGKGVCWSHPAFANQCVFARNDEELICASLAK